MDCYFAGRLWPSTWGYLLDDQYFLAFIVLIGVLITVHEFGHFAVAKLCGVKVEMFSIGFGKPIIKVVRGETEYRIAWLPFGGYVKLLGQIPGEAVTDAADEGRSLQDKGPFQRILIYAAGPAMNLILPFAIIVPFVTLADRYAKVEGSQVGALDQSMPAWMAGLREGDMITAIDGESVRTFCRSNVLWKPIGPTTAPYPSLFAGTEPIKTRCFRFVQNRCRAATLPGLQQHRLPHWLSTGFPRPNHRDSKS